MASVVASRVAMSSTCLIGNIFLALAGAFLTTQFDSSTAGSYWLLTGAALIGSVISAICIWLAKPRETGSLWVLIGGIFLLIIILLIVSSLLFSGRWVVILGLGLITLLLSAIPVGLAKDAQST